LPGGSPYFWYADQGAIRTIPTMAATPSQRQLGIPRRAAITSRGMTPKMLAPWASIARAQRAANRAPAQSFPRSSAQSGVRTIAAAASSIAAGSIFGQTKKPLRIARLLSRRVIIVNARVRRPTRPASSSAQAPTIQSCWRTTPSTW
jgi:hypothetical protein